MESIITNAESLTNSSFFSIVSLLLQYEIDIVIGKTIAFVL